MPNMRVAAPHILRFNAKRMGKRSHVFPITMLQHGNQQADFVLEMVYDRRLESIRMLRLT